jgi:hypothetical protein
LLIRRSVAAPFAKLAYRDCCSEFVADRLAPASGEPARATARGSVDGAAVFFSDCVKTIRRKITAEELQCSHSDRLRELSFDIEGRETTRASDQSLPGSDGGLRE